MGIDNIGALIGEPDDDKEYLEELAKQMKTKPKEQDASGSDDVLPDY